MGEPAKPAAIPDWSTNAGATIATPPGGKIAIGWVAEKPPFQFWNWLHYYTAKWIRYFQAKNDILPGANANTILTPNGAGLITPTQGNHEVSGNNPLVTIDASNFGDGRLLLLSFGVDMLIRITDNIILKNKNDLLVNPQTIMVFELVGPNWYEVSRSIPYRPEANSRLQLVPAVQFPLNVQQTQTPGPRLDVTTPQYNFGDTVTSIATDGVYVFSGNVNGANSDVEYFRAIDFESLAGIPIVGKTIRFIISDGFYIWILLVTAGGVASLVKVSLNAPTVIITTTALGTINNWRRMVFDGTYIWIAADANILLVNRLTGAIDHTYTGAGTYQSLIFDGTNVWGLNGGFLDKFDATGNRLAHINQTANNLSNQLAFDGALIWGLDSVAVALKAYDLTGTLVASSAFAIAAVNTDLISDGKYLYWIEGNDISMRMARPNSTDAVVTLTQPFGANAPTQLCVDHVHLFATCNAANKLRRFVKP